MAMSKIHQQERNLRGPEKLVHKHSPSWSGFIKTTNWSQITHHCSSLFVLDRGYLKPPEPPEKITGPSGGWPSITQSHLPLRHLQKGPWDDWSHRCFCRETSQQTLSFWHPVHVSHSKLLPESMVQDGDFQYWERNQKSPNHPQSLGVCPGSYTPGSCSFWQFSPQPPSLLLSQLYRWLSKPALVE
jgi:hypothetical protein